MRAFIALLIMSCGVAREAPRNPTPPMKSEDVTASTFTATSLREVNGRIALVDNAGMETLVTEGPNDHDAALAPNRRLIAFVRDSDLYVISPTSKPKRVLAARPPPPSGPVEEGLLGIRTPLFSPNSATLYFTTDAWSTSHAAHALDLPSGATRFLYDGETREVLANGNLVATHFRIVWLHGQSQGRHEVWTLNDPTGKELRPLPTDEAERRKVLGSL